MKKILYIFIAINGLLQSVESFSQIRGLPRLPTPTGGNKGSDTLSHRTGLEDSITIRFRYLDTSKLYSFDSSIYDFTKRLPVPATYYHLGNLGTAANSFLFTPYMKAGWDPGFHSLDIYKFTLEDTKFYNTTRPYSELGYLLGSKAEQLINLIHTQNILPNWNFALQYRLINSPGSFLNQNTNHNNYRLNSWYQSKNKRYSNFFVVLANNLQSAENGGILNDESYLDSSAYKERRGIPVKLGPQTTAVSNNFFTTKIPTGNKYRDVNFFLRQQYDIGQKDSLVLDTTVIPLFYPRLRLEYNVRLSFYRYRFEDAYVDSGYYRKYYNLDTASLFYMQDKWTEVLNDFSIYTFPDKKNPQQFLKLGAAMQNLTARFDSSKATGTRTNNYYNFFAHGEYRNHTRNQQWDIEAFGNLYLAGLNSGDYDAYISLKRLVSRKLGSLQLGFRNTSRTPSYIFNPNSSFWKEPVPKSFNKENITALFAAIEEPKLGLRLMGQYFLVTNFTYFTGINKRAQANIFNVLQVGAEKTFNLADSWKWRSWLVLQQKAGSSPVNIPLLWTRNLIGYEGNLGFKNLDMAFGFEIKYHTNYKANGYSPLMGQFYLQDTLTLTRNRPEVHTYVHFRIRSFTAYFRVENLNTLQISGKNSGFTKNNLVAPDYPTPGLLLRLGIFWSFVN